MYKFIFFLFFAILFSSCYNKVYVNGHYSHRGPNNYPGSLKYYYDDSSYLLFNNSEKIPDSSIFVERVEIKSDFAGEPYSNYSPAFELTQELKIEARVVGSNVIKIVTDGEIKRFPQWGVRIVAELYKLKEPAFTFYKELASTKTSNKENVSVIYLKNFWHDAWRKTSIGIYYNDSLIVTCNRPKKINGITVIDFAQAKLTVDGFLANRFNRNRIPIEMGHQYYIHIIGSYKYNQPRFQFCSKYDF